MTTTTEAPLAPSGTGVARVGALATMAALATNLAIFGMARAVGVDFEFPRTGSASRTTVAAGMVVGATLVAMAVGWALAALAARQRQLPMRTMAITGGVVGLASTLAPLSLDGDAAAKLTLAGLHLVTAACYLAGIARLRRGDIGDSR